MLAVACALLLAAVCGLTLVAAAHAKRGCQSHRCESRVAAKKCSQQNPRACIRHAILYYRMAGWQAAWLHRVSRCESGGNPYARNPSGASGLFQFLPSTWQTTPYGRHSIWSARHQALAAAWMLRQGRAREWVCN